MYDSLIALIQMLDNSEKDTNIFIYQFGSIQIIINQELFIYKYTQDGISQAIEELENII